MPQTINLAQKFALFEETWTPKIVGELNGQQVKLAKFEGEYVWHSHADEDEMFLIVAGVLRLEFRDHAVELRPGEFCIVPRGVEHKPVALEPVQAVLFEPDTTRSTGTVDEERTVEAGDAEWI